MRIPELQTATDGPVELNSPDELRRFVKLTLCRREQLDPAQFSMSEVPLVRRGHPCGTTFRILGPRAVTLLALWIDQDRRLFFYDSAGTRFLTAQVAAADS